MGDHGESSVLDQELFASTASVLPRELVRTFLDALIARGEDLLCRLSGDLASGDRRRLMASAHKLGGSAGSFGFRRLAEAAAAFEHAVDTAADDADIHREALRRATEASIGKLRELALAG